MEFDRYTGIDYSGAETADSSLRGLRIYMAQRNSPPEEVLPPPSPRRYWTRRAAAEWLVELLSGDSRTLVGIDHAFSFPRQYFQTNQIPFDCTDWTAFLEDFQHHWPTDRKNTYVDFVIDGLTGDATARSGKSTWRRLTELRARTAKSVFHFNVQGSVAKSTHAGLPWLLYVRRNTKGRVHFWPFDGWSISHRQSVITEVYPSLWSRAFPCQTRTRDQHDAWSVAEWLRNRDADGSLNDFFAPRLTEEEKRIADIEGWILGVA